MTASLNGENLEVKDKIQSKLRIALLIEMGVFDKPEAMTVDDEQFIVENLHDF